jgi:hypothetical protein
MIQGVPFIELSLDMNNTKRGYLPNGFTHYDDLDYDEGTYEITAVYQSYVLYKENGIQSIETYGIGDSEDIMIQWRTYTNGSYSSWSDEIDGIGVNIIDTENNPYVQLRFIFKSPNIHVVYNNKATEKNDKDEPKHAENRGISCQSLGILR